MYGSLQCISLKEIRFNRIIFEKVYIIVRHVHLTYNLTLTFFNCMKISEIMYKQFLVTGCIAVMNLNMVSKVSIAVWKTKFVNFFKYVCSL